MESLGKRYGWRVSHALRCPRVVAGKHCLAYRGDVPRRCICQSYFIHPMDHARMWIDRNGQHVLTCEPYGLDDSFPAFCRDMHDLGLEVETSPDSPWDPGQTTLVIVRRRPMTPVGADTDKLIVANDDILERARELAEAAITGSDHNGTVILITAGLLVLGVVIAEHLSEVEIERLMRTMHQNILRNRAQAAAEMNDICQPS